MPLFFIIAGYLLNNDKWQGKVKAFVINRFNRLIVPYFEACIFFYLFWVFIDRHFSKSALTPIIKPFIGIFYGDGAWLSNPPLWFLPCLFIAELIFINLLSFGTNKIKLYTITIASAILEYLISKVVFLPWGLDIALVWQPFLLLGNQIKKLDVVNKLNGFYVLLVSGISMAILFVSFYTNSGIDISRRCLENVFIFYAGAISGTICIFSISMLASKFQFIKEPIMLCGKESLVILVFHLLGFKIVSAIAVFIFHLQLQVARQELWIIYSVAGIVVPLGLVWFTKNSSIIKKTLLASNNYIKI